LAAPNKPGNREITELLISTGGQMLLQKQQANQEPAVHAGLRQLPVSRCGEHEQEIIRLTTFLIATQPILQTKLRVTKPGKPLNPKRDSNHSRRKSGTAGGRIFISNQLG